MPRTILRALLSSSVLAATMIAAPVCHAHYGPVCDGGAPIAPGLGYGAAPSQRQAQLQVAQLQDLNATDDRSTRRLGAHSGGLGSFGNGSLGSGAGSGLGALNGSGIGTYQGGGLGELGSQQDSPAPRIPDRVGRPIGGGGGTGR